MSIYNNAEKNAWRRWAWDHMAKNLSPGSRVLVMCGDTTLDVDEAERVGLRVVGCDFKEANVSRFRDRKVPAVVADIYDAAPYLKTEGVIADFLGDINHHMVSRFSYQKAVVVNFMRGRSVPKATEQDHYIVREVASVIPVRFTTDEPQSNLLFNHKHRGFQFLLTRASSGVFSRMKRGCDPVESIIYELRTQFKRLRPHLFSYKSSRGMYFDSVAYCQDFRSEVPVHPSQRLVACKAVLSRRRAVI